MSIKKISSNQYRYRGVDITVDSNDGWISVNARLETPEGVSVQLYSSGPDLVRLKEDIIRRIEAHLDGEGGQTG